MRISQKEIDILRALGEQYMIYASSPVQAEKLRMWRSINRGAMERPMVIIDQLPWHELEAAAPGRLKVQITDPYWAKIERELRQTIYQWESFPADMVMEPFITVPAAVHQTGYGIVAEEDTIVRTENETASSHHYIGVIKEPEDIGKIQDIRITNNSAQSLVNLQEAESIFENLAPVRLSHGVQFHLGVWDTLSTFMGVENVFYDMMDRPEFLHAVMKRITDATVAGIKNANELRVHNDNANTCHCSYIYTDELLPGFGAGLGPVSKNCWGMGLAQLFTSLSPDSFGEFELPYISSMAEHFGGIYYGCCDRLDDRLDLVKKIPNVRKVSCSPWSDRDKFAEKLDKTLVLSNKPTPAYLAGSSFDEGTIRQDIAHTCKAAKDNGLSVELILKDISTVNNDPSRLIRWHEIAMREVCE